MKKMNEVCYYKLLFYVILLGKPSKNKKLCTVIIVIVISFEGNYFCH